jgi:hypothetical protein
VRRPASRGARLLPVGGSRAGSSHATAPSIVPPPYWYVRGTGPTFQAAVAAADATLFASGCHDTGTAADGQLPGGLWWVAERGLCY